MAHFTTRGVALPIGGVLDSLGTDANGRFLLGTRFRRLRRTVTRAVSSFHDNLMSLPRDISHLIAQLRSFTLVTHSVLPSSRPLSRSFLQHLRCVGQKLTDAPARHVTLVDGLHPGITDLVAIFSSADAVCQRLDHLTRRKGPITRQLISHLTRTSVPPTLRTDLITVTHGLRTATSAAHGRIRRFNRRIRG